MLASAAGRKKAKVEANRLDDEEDQDDQDAGEAEAEEDTVNGVPLVGARISFLHCGRDLQPAAQLTFWIRRQTEILANGVKREDIQLDSELEDVRDFPTHLSDESLYKMQYAVHFELTKLFEVQIVSNPCSTHSNCLHGPPAPCAGSLMPDEMQDEWINFFPGKTVDDFIAAYNDGSLFEVT